MANNFSNQDSFDIQELATLNEEISIDFIEQLQNQVAQNASDFSGRTNDGALFEEVNEQENSNTSANQDSNTKNINEQDTSSESESIAETPEQNNNNSTPKESTKNKVNLEDSFDDNFIKKYKAKLRKQKNQGLGVDDYASSSDSGYESSKSIEKLTSGNIVEKPIVAEQISYNDSLDYLDENIKYSKYVIYIDPENTDFIESLTVKERKNLINRILHEQDNIAMTKKRFTTIQAIIKHTIIAILTVTVSIPIIYYTINASLEATINNYRSSQTNIQTLYREKGKIKATKIVH